MNRALFTWLPVEFTQVGPADSRDHLTVVHTTKPCGKRIKLAADGTANWKSLGDVIEGVAITIRVPAVEAMATLLRLLPANHYIIPDFIPAAGREPFEIMAQWRLNKALGMSQEYRPAGMQKLCRHVLPVFAKIKENFLPGAWRLCDFDRDEHTPQEIRALTVTDAIARLEEALPGLKGCARVVALSSKGRVLGGDGKPLSASPNFHMWLHVADPDLTDLFRGRLWPRLAECGIGWRKPRKSRSEPGKVLGYGPAGLIDPSVWAISRCVYAGAPAVDVGLTLANAAVLAHEGRRFFLASLPPSSDKAVAAAVRVLGVKATRNRDGSARFYDDTQLQPDTIIEVHGRGTITLAEFLMNPAFVAGTKYRCQTPFRESSSWNGILHKYTHGSASVHDNGTGVTYRYMPPGSLAVLLKEQLEQEKKATDTKHVTRRRLLRARWRVLGDRHE